MDGKVESSKIIVEGEASESDEDELSEHEAGTEGTQLPQSKMPSHDGQDGESDSKQEVNLSKTGVVVSGEASESDEEFEVVTSEGHILPLNVNKSERGDTSDMTPQSPSLPVLQRETKPKYNTLLNRKLRERNIALRRHIVDTIHQSYTQAAKDLHNLTVQLQKSHIAIQDVSFHMRNTTNDLFHLEDKVDIVGSCNLLPDITIPAKPVIEQTAAQT